MRSCLQKCASWPMLLKHLFLKVENKQLHLEGPPFFLSRGLLDVVIFAAAKASWQTCHEIWKCS